MNGLVAGRRVGADPTASRIEGLDIARGLSVVTVMLGHLFAVMHTALPVPIPNFTHGLILLTNLAVEVFFALSGFLLGGSLLRKSALSEPGVVSSYALHRITRTWPAYFGLMFLLLFFDAALRGHWQVHWSYFFFLQNFVDGAERFFAVTWSLSIEEWSYVLLPLLIIGLPRYLARKGYAATHAVFLAALAIIAVSLLARLFVALVWHPPFDMGLRKQLHLRMDALMFGLAVAYCRHVWPEIYRKLASFPALLIIVALTVAHMGLQHADQIFERAVPPGRYFFHGTLGITLTCAFAALVLPFMDGNEAFLKTMRRLPLARALLLGAARYSYSLYLVHLPIFEGLRSVYNGHVPAAPWGAWVVVPLMMAVGLILSQCAAWVLYYSLEKPGMDLRKSLLRIKKRFTQTARRVEGDIA